VDTVYKHRYNDNGLRKKSDRLIKASGP